MVNVFPVEPGYGRLREEARLKLLVMVKISPSATGPELPLRASVSSVAEVT
jgi:hypothetical protein